MSYKNRSAESIEAQKEYKKLNERPYRLVFFKKTDADIIEKLDSVDNRTRYVRTLIRQDLEREKKEK